MEDNSAKCGVRWLMRWVDDEPGMFVAVSQSSTMSSVSQQSSRRPEDPSQAQRPAFGRQGTFLEFIWRSYHLSELAVLFKERFYLGPLNI